MPIIADYMQEKGQVLQIYKKQGLVILCTALSPQYNIYLPMM